VTTDPSHDSDDEFVGDESSDDFESENTMVFDSVEIPPPPASEESEESVADEPLDEASAEVESADDSDEADNAVFDISELQTPPPPPEGFGGPEDASEEQPMLVVSQSDEAVSLPVDSTTDDPSDEISTRPRETPLRGAYEYLEIRTPIAEFESYARARTEALVRLGDSKDAEIAALAMNLGTEALKRVMGAIPKETL
jgi:hypothetical protein